MSTQKYKIKEVNNKKSVYAQENISNKEIIGLVTTALLKSKKLDDKQYITTDASSSFKTCLEKTILEENLKNNIFSNAKLEAKDNKVYLVSTKKINEGDEITITYGDSKEELDKAQKFVAEQEKNKKDNNNIIRSEPPPSLDKVKKLPYKTLNRLINKLKQQLKKDEVIKKMFKEYKVDLDEIDYIPMMFGDLNVSAKTNHGTIIYNYKLLADGEFFKDFSYGVHEMTHWLQQTTGDKPTKSSNSGSYLDNKYEKEGFQNQIEYIAKEFGENEAERYVDDLLDYHEIDSKKEYNNKKEVLMSKV